MPSGYKRLRSTSQTPDSNNSPTSSPLQSLAEVVSSQKSHQLVFDLRRDATTIQAEPCPDSITYITSQNPHVQELIQEILMTSEFSLLKIMAEVLKNFRIQNNKDNLFKDLNPLKESDLPTSLLIDLLAQFKTQSQVVVVNPHHNN